MFELTPISLVLFITTAFNLIVSFISWQRRKTQVGLYFALGAFSVTFWTLASGFDYAAIPILLKVLFAKLEYIGYNFAFVFFGFFSFYYAGYERWLKDIRLKVFFAIVLVSNILLAWTNDWTGWLWVSFTRSDVGENTVIFEHGPGEFWAAVTGYMMVLIIILPLWQASRHGSDVSRRQARLIFFATLLPVAGNLVYLFQPPQFKGVDWSSLLFSVSSILCLLALYGTRFLDIVPIARDQLVKSMSDGMVVLDTQDRIIDINHTAASMIQSLPEKLIGKSLAEVFPLAQPVPEWKPEQEIRTEFEFGDTDRHYFDVLISPLQENRETILGRLIIFRDITTRKENELRLLQLTQAVEQSPASVMVTDLNGNIEYVNPRFSMLTGYAFDEAIGKTPGILKSGHTHEGVYDEMWQTVRSGKAWQGEFLSKKKSGELYWERVVMAPVLDRTGEIVNFIAVKEDITRRRRLESERESMIKELEKRNAESQSLRETTVIVTSTLDVSDVVQRILQQIKHVIVYDSASVWLYKGVTAYLVGGDGIPDLSEDEKQYTMGDTNPDFPLWSQHLPYVLHNDIQKEYAIFREAPINYIHGWMAIPLKARDRLIGFISLDSKQAGYFTHHDAQLALIYASQVSIALENARLFSNLQDELYQRQELINELDVKNAELERVARDLHESQAQLVEQQRVLAALDERQRLGRNMHDSVNQSIHGLMLFADTLIALLQKDQAEKAIDVAGRIQESGRQALKEIRLLVYETQSLLTNQDADLIGALEDRLNMVERRVGIKAEIICDDGFMDYCPPEWNENLYWMVMEGLNNSLKHAQARSITIIIHCTKKQLAVEVKDDGVGFDPGHARGGGFGMRTMRERAEILGGELSVKSSQGQGTSINFSTEIGA